MLAMLAARAAVRGPRLALDQDMAGGWVGRVLMPICGGPKYEESASGCTAGRAWKTAWRRQDPGNWLCGCVFPFRYEFFADDLPIWGFVGPPPEQTKGDSNVYIYTHKSLDVAYNGNRVSLPEGWEFHNSASDSYMCLWHALVHTSIPGWSSVGGEESSG